MSVTAKTLEQLKATQEKLDKEFEGRTSGSPYEADLDQLARDAMALIPEWRDISEAPVNETVLVGFLWGEPATAYTRDGKRWKRSRNGAPILPLYYMPLPPAPKGEE